LTRCGSVICSGWRRGWRTRTTVLGASSPSRGLSPERRRVRRRAAVEVSLSVSGVVAPRPEPVRVPGTTVGRSGAWNITANGEPWLATGSAAALAAFAVLGFGVFAGF
jgi:hypothetical protein